MSSLIRFTFALSAYFVMRGLIYEATLYLIPTTGAVLALIAARELDND